ncbi:MAG: DoxX family protein [Gemmatimonadetes bacterium]|nr:DoxX family protein [Gemmatimonadota bacterium]MBL0177864.1 DoxX family protein [Gemmatimonadota bacterium]
MPATTVLAMLRRVVACLMAVHGAYRAALPERVRGFGSWLTSLHLPAGELLAAAITGAELAGAVALWFGWRRRVVSLLFVAELLIGIVLIHATEGWFVVGGGRNGMEYSVLLIAVLLAVAAEAPPRHDTA